MLLLNLLGPVTAEMNGSPFTHFGTVRGQALLIYLALERDRVHQREAIMHLLWPDMPLKSAQGNLRQTIYLLRKAFQDAGMTEPPILSARQTVQFDPDFPLAVDVHEFEAAAAGTVESRQAAADRYCGSFLADFYLPDSEPFEEWAAARRAAYGRLALENLDQLAAHYLGEADYAAAEKAARRTIALDELHEPAHRHLLQALALSGKRGDALAHYEAFTQQLAEELAIEPDERTQQLLQSIRTGQLAVPKSDIRHPKSDIQNLPAQTKPFIGREKELQQLSLFFSLPDTRLVTIVGPGGMGKTQLAIEWARGQKQYRDGVHFIDLVPMESSDQVAPAMAELFAFPLQDERRSPEEQILDYLREKELLLIFDNFEHILDAAAFVNDILHRASNVDILVTSRARLHFSSEQVYGIEGLSYPPGPAQDPPGVADDLKFYPAVQLFLERAARTQPGYNLAPDDREPLARICRITAGMPLAIELAAAWTDLFTLRQIAQNIERRLDLLEKDMPDLAPRHRSIRAAIDTTWDHLEPVEQDLFALISIFRGGFTWDAARAVLDLGDGEDGLQRTLLTLRDKSLIVFNTRSQRFSIHELLRQYAAEKLQAVQKAGEFPSTREKHALFYAHLLAEQEPGLKGPQFMETLRLIERDFENMLAAWGWFIDHERSAELGTVMDSLGLFQEYQGYYATGRRSFKTLATRWQERLAGQPAGSAERTRDLPILAKALAWQSAFELDRQKAGSLLLKSLALLDDPRLDEGQGNAERAFVCYRLSLILRHPQPAKAIEYSNQALAFYQAGGDLWGVGRCLQSHGQSIRYINHEKSRVYLLQAIEIFEQIDDTRSLAHSLLFLIESVSLLDDDEAIEKTLTKYLAVVAGLEQSVFTCETLMTHASVYTARGQFSQAILSQKKLIDYFKTLGRSISFQKVELAIVYLHAGQFDKGRALLLQARGDFEEKAVENDHRLAFCYQLFGMLALAEDAHEEAVDYLHQALLMYRTMDSRVDLVSANALLAIALFGLGDLDAARSHLVASLKSNLDRTGFLALQEAFLGMALLKAEQGDILQARQLLELVWRQPRFKKSALFNGIAGHEIAARTAELSPADLKAVRQQAAETDPWQKAASLYKELLAAGWAG